MTTSTASSAARPPTISTARCWRPSTNSTTSPSISDETWAALGEQFDERQRMDLVFTVGCYGMLAMALNTFGVEPDSDENRGELNRGILPKARCG